jgi:hypothetical protein
MQTLQKTPSVYSNLKTRHEEKRFKTSNLEEAKGLFTAERVLRTWKQDFVDEDTAEVVSIDRNEIILDRGTLLDSEKISSLNFYLMSGDIKEIEVSDQQRIGIFTEFMTSIWLVTAYINGKKKNIYLYANSILSAIEIVKDFLEQSNLGSFGITQVKHFDNLVLITENYEFEDENDDENFNWDEPKEPETYRIELEIEHEELTDKSDFIVKAIDAEKAKVQIERFLSLKFQKEERETEFVTTLISAKVVPCETLIDYEFCSKYLNKED